MRGVVAEDANTLAVRNRGEEILYSDDIVERRNDDLDGERRTAKLLLCSASNFQHYQGSRLEPSTEPNFVIGTKAAFLAYPC